METTLKNLLRIIVVVVALLESGMITGTTIKAQKVENDFQARTELKLSFRPLKRMKLSLAPEIRIDDKFTLDKYLFEGAVEYKPLKILSLETTYRFVVNKQEDKGNEYFNRFALSATAKKEFRRFEPAFRLRYSNDADDQITDKEFLRYKASVKYDIAHCKITPFAAVEAFQPLDGGGLYKMRYSAGGYYKLFKKNYLGMNYKFDYYLNEYRNRHIITVGYKIKF